MDESAPAEAVVALTEAVAPTEVAVARTRIALRLVPIAAALRGLDCRASAVAVAVSAAAGASKWQRDQAPMADRRLAAAAQGQVVDGPVRDSSAVAGPARVALALQGPGVKTLHRAPAHVPAAHVPARGLAPAAVSVPAWQIGRSSGHPATCVPRRAPAARIGQAWPAADGQGSSAQASPE
jgi:hypothetical protein